MKTIKELLAEKELELAKVGRELEALRLVTPLLLGAENADDKSTGTSALPTAKQEPEPQKPSSKDGTVVDCPILPSRWIRLQESTTRFFTMTFTRGESSPQGDAQKK
jgi:hypothetical protein